MTIRFQRWNLSAVATIATTLVPASAIASVGQGWDVSYTVQGNGAATSTLTATYVIGWTQAAATATATMSVAQRPRDLDVNGIPGFGFGDYGNVYVNGSERDGNGVGGCGDCDSVVLDMVG